MLFNIRQCKNIKKGKYPDVYIFLPKKKIETKRSIMRLNFVLLYSNLIMFYNFSSEKIILTYEEADIMQKNENNLYKIEFSFNNHIIYT